MTDFPNIRKLGLEVEENADGYFTLHYVRASDLERILESAVRVYNAHAANGMRYDSWFTNQTHTATESALLIGIEPIKRETANEFVKAWLECADAWGVGSEWIERARRVLNG